MPRRHLLVVPLVALALWSCASSRDREIASVHETGNGIRLTVDAAAASALLGGFLDGDLDCSDPADGALGAVLDRLDREGPRSRATFRDEDGRLSGRRHGSRVTLEADGGDGRLEVQMSWAAAECLLGRPTDLERAMKGLTIALVAEDGRRSTLRLD